MKKITGPIDGMVLISRALEFSNTSDITDGDSVCRRARVLPPGSPYLINQRGDVFAVPRRKRDISKVTANAHLAMRAALYDIVSGKVPMMGSEPKMKFRRPRKEIEDLASPTGKSTLIDLTKKEWVGATIDFSLPTRRWFRVQGVKRRQTPKKTDLSVSEGDDLIIPTLDGLVAAAALVMYEYRDHIRKCPHCPNYFVRPNKKKATCGKVECERKRRQKNNREALSRYRKARKARHVMGVAE